jgi:hypothetical protein
VIPAEEAPDVWQDGGPEWVQCEVCYEHGEWTDAWYIEVYDWNGYEMDKYLCAEHAQHIRRYLTQYPPPNNAGLLRIESTPE